MTTTRNIISSRRINAHQRGRVVSIHVQCRLRPTAEGCYPKPKKPLKKGRGGRGVILIALGHKGITRGMGQRKRVQVMPRGGK